MEQLIKQVQPIMKLFKNIYVVGGTVRDTVLGKEPNDLDFACRASVDEIESTLHDAGFKTWRLNKEPQTVGTKLGEKKVEISSFTGSSIEADLLHRDFTINAMATRDGKIIDPQGGLKDISKQLIRCTKSPRDRIREDPLRMLRAIRFVSVLGFRLDEKTKTSIQMYAHSILITHKERWLDELTKLLVGDNVKPALELLFKTRLLGYLLPEVYPITMYQRNQTTITKDLWYHTKVVVNKSKPTPIVRWAALLHDIAKPQTIICNKDTHFLHHEYLGAEMADVVLQRLKVGTTMKCAVRGIIMFHQRVGDVVSRRNDPPVSVSALRRLTRDCDNNKCKVEDLVELFAADCSSGRKDVVERQQAHSDLLRKALKEMREEDLKPRLPKGIGDSLMKHFDLEPGPEVGRMKKRLDAMLVSGKIEKDMTHEQMFELLIKEG